MPLAKQFAAARKSAPLDKPERRSRYWPSEKELQKKQVAELRMLVKALCVLEKVFQKTGKNEPYRAVPRSSLRIRHPT
jgi:hypothetical protein